MSSSRSRIVEGSCWSCKKRRIKCDLTKPACRRCTQSGSVCDYNARLIRWSKRPTPSVPADYQVFNRGDYAGGSSIQTWEKGALDYFHRRVWPLLSTSVEPCPPPTPVALEYRVVLMTTCLLADSHRLLQDGNGSIEKLNSRRVECFAAIRSELDGCSNDKEGPLLTLLFAVLLLYLDDGFMECMSKTASTLSHHAGVLAILQRMGGLETMLQTGTESLQMLLALFVSADLTSCMLRGKPPSFPAEVWDTVDRGAVWWGRDPMNRCSLASIFKELASMSFYIHATTNSTEELSMDRIREFEVALRPIYAPLSLQDLDNNDGTSDSGIMTEQDAEVLHVFTLIRAFQHSALIFLYRALCGLSTFHPLVQQHVQSCLDAIFEIPRHSHVLNCVIFPLCIAGAHTSDAGKQRPAVLEKVQVIYEDTRFASVHSVRHVFDAIWKGDAQNQPWTEMFAEVSPHAVVL